MSGRSIPTFSELILPIGLVLLMVFSSVLKYEFDPLESTETKFTSPHTAVSLVMDGSGYFDENCSPTSIAFGTNLLFTCGGQGLYFYNSNTVEDVRPPPITQQMNVGISDSTFVIMDGFAYFEGNLNGQLQGLWRSDGSNVGTSLVKQISSINHLTAINGSLYFAGQSSAGIEPWISDGTNAGTKMAGDLVPGAGSSNPQEFVEFDGKVFMTAENETGERHIYWNGWTSKVSDDTNQISEAPALGQQASIGAASGDDIIVVSRGVDNANLELVLNTESSGSFQPVSITSANNMRDADVVVDGNGIMHVSYVNYGSGDLVYFSTTEWPNANSIVHYNLEAIQNTYHSSIDVDSYNNPFVAYMDDAGNKIRLKYRLDSTWNEALVDGNPSFRPTIQIDDYNNVHINYVSSNGTLMHALSTERINNFSSWSISEIAGPSTSLGAFAGPSMSINDVNRVGMAATSVSDEEVRFFRNKIVNTDTDNSVISLGEKHSCVLTDDSSVVCWGSQTEAFGINISSSVSTPKVIDDLEGKDTVQITSSVKGNCALSGDGDVRCWGNNSHGSLGLGSIITGNGGKGEGVQLIDLGTDVSIEQIDSNVHVHCAITDEGSVLCWGLNTDGQLGIGDNNGSKNKIGDDVNEMGDYLDYVDLGTNITAKQVSVGGQHTCAILNNDLVKCWGDNAYGQLGIDTNGSNVGDNEGEMGDNLSYVDLGTGRTAKQITLGTSHTCAILDNDLVKCWGLNAFGRLGIGGGPSTHTPTSVSLGTGQTANSIDAGEAHTCMLLNNAEVLCWGHNDNGQLGDGSSSSSRAYPDDVEAYGYPNTRDVVAIKTGIDHSCAVLEDFSLSCWGQNSDGQLGVAGVSQSSMPLTPAMLGWEVIGTTFVDHEDILGTSGAGRHNSIAVDGDGVIHIAHGNIIGNGYLRYSKNSPVSGWSSEIVDNISTTGRYTSTYVEDNGEVHISYYDHGAKDLKYAHHDGNGWTISTVDSGGDVGLFTSLVVGSDGMVHISYTDYSNMDLKYARYDGYWWGSFTVDSGGTVGQYTSIDMDANNNAVISYYDASNKDLKLAVCTTTSPLVPPSCSTSTVSSTGAVGTTDTDIEIDEFGTIHILYQDSTDATNISLEYAYGDVGNFSSMSIDYGVIGFASLAIDDGGNIYVVYFDKENDDLRYAFSHISSNPPTWESKIMDDGDLIYNSDLQNYPTGHSSMVVDEDGTLHVSYLDLTQGNLKYGSITNIDTQSDELTAMTSDQDDFIAIYSDDITSEVYSLRLTEDGIVEHPVVIGQGQITTHSITTTKSSGDIYVSMQSDMDALEIYTAFSETDDWSLVYERNAEHGDWSSVSTINDKVQFSYFDAYRGNLLFSCPSCTTATGQDTEIIDSGGTNIIVGKMTAMEVDSQGKTHIAYYDETNGELKYAYGGYQNWSTSTVTIPSSSDVGNAPSLALDSNNQPHICYFDYDGQSVTYTHFDGANWTFFDVPGSNTYCQIAIDSNDIVHMTYTAISSTYNTKYATKLPTSNINSWNTTTIGSFFAYAGKLLFDNEENLYLVYDDFATGDIDYCYKLSGSTTWTGPNLISSDFSPWVLGAVMDSNSDLHISFVDQVTLDLVYITNSVPGNSSFTSQIIQTDILSDSSVSITVDSNDDIHISYMNNYNLQHTTLQGSGKGINGGDFNRYNTGISMPDTFNVTGPNAGQLTVMGDNLYFVGSYFSPSIPYTTGLELNKIGPDSSFVSLVKDINPYNDGSDPNYLTVAGDTLYFRANDGTYDKLWKSDGTNAGTVAVADVGLIGDQNGNQNQIIAVEDSIFFRGKHGNIFGYELWTSDGTTSGTYQVKDIRAGSMNGLRGNFDAARNTAVVGNALYFVADDGVNGDELWVTQGNETNTFMVADINVGSGESYIDSMVVIGETVYFDASDGVNGNRLWKTISSQQTSPADIEIPFIGFDYQNHLFEVEFTVQNIEAANGPWEVDWYITSGAISDENSILIDNGTVGALNEATLTFQPDSITNSATLICASATLTSGNGTTVDSDESCFEPPLIMSDSNYEVNGFDQEGIHNPLSCSDVSLVSVGGGNYVCDRNVYGSWVSADVADIPTDDLFLSLNYSESIHADGFGIYIGDTGYSSYLDKGRLMAYDEVAQDWLEVGVFDIPFIDDDEEAQWVTFTGFSVNASSFLIDVDRNVGDFGHTVVWEIILFEHPEIGDEAPSMVGTFELGDDELWFNVSINHLNPLELYHIDFGIQHPGLPWHPETSVMVDSFSENISSGSTDYAFTLPINVSQIKDNWLFCADAHLILTTTMASQEHINHCSEKSNFLQPRIVLTHNSFENDELIYAGNIEDVDEMVNGSVKFIIFDSDYILSNSSVYFDSIDPEDEHQIEDGVYSFNQSLLIGHVFENGEIAAHYHDYCYAVEIYEGDQSNLDNLLDREFGCRYTENDAEVHVLLNFPDYGFTIQNMSTDYVYSVWLSLIDNNDSTIRIDSVIENLTVDYNGDSYTYLTENTLWNFSIGEEYCVYADLAGGDRWSENQNYDMFLGGASWCKTYTGNSENNTGNETNENNTGNQSGPSPEIFANLSFQEDAESGVPDNLIANYSLSNVSIGESYALSYEIIHATNDTCSENFIQGNSLIREGDFNFDVDESMTMYEQALTSTVLSYFVGMDSSILDSHYCLILHLESAGEIIDTDFDSISWASIHMVEPNPELSVEFTENGRYCEESEWYCDEGTMFYTQGIDIELDAAWYGYNHSVSLKLSNENGIIIYSYFSPNENIYLNGGWHHIPFSTYNELSIGFNTDIRLINSFAQNYFNSEELGLGDLSDLPDYWTGDTRFLTMKGGGEDDGQVLEVPYFEAGEYCLEISIGYQKDLNDSSLISFRNLFDKQTYCGTFEYASSEGINWDAVDDGDDTCDDLTDSSCVELLCENWEEQNPMLVDPRLENNGCPYELEIPEWWEEIPIVGDQISNIVETVQTEFGRYIGAVVFAVTILGYAYRALTARSNFKRAKRMKKFERRIDKSNTKKDLDKVDGDVEKAEDKNLLPTGGYGDLKEMIETRLEDLFGDGSSGGDEENEFMSKGFGHEDANDMFNEMQSGMEAMRETQQEMSRMAESMRENQDSLFRQNIAPGAGGLRGGPKRPSQRPTAQIESLGKASGGPSRPSYHPKDLDEDGVVSEEDLRNWEKLSEGEKRARLTGSVRGGGSLTSEIVAFSKIPGSSRARCYCGSGKAYGKCHLSKEMCPCGSGKKFLKCCAKKRGFR